MSKVALIKWGNSVGIRVPANDIKKANAYVGEEFELIVNKQGGFTIIPIQDPQAGWLEGFNAIADADQDEELIGHIKNDFDEDEWKW